MTHAAPCPSVESLYATRARAQARKEFWARIQVALIGAAIGAAMLLHLTA